MKTAHQRVSFDHNSNGSAGPKVEVDSFMDRDEREMAILGKKQQLKVGRRILEKCSRWYPVLTGRQRNFGFMSILGFSCTLMVTWEGMFW